MAPGTGSVLVPKGPRAEKSAAGPSIEELRRQLFAMPLPPNPTRTRTYSTDTALGRIMRLRGLSITEVTKMGGPSTRQISDHLRGLRALSETDRRLLAENLGIDRRLLD